MPDRRLKLVSLNLNDSTENSYARSRAPTSTHRRFFMRPPIYQKLDRLIETQPEAATMVEHLIDDCLNDSLD